MQPQELVLILLEENALWEYDGKFHVLGGPGSGHYGHKGIPGHRGGSAPSGSNFGPSPQLSESEAFGTSLTDRSFGNKELTETLGTVYRGTLYKDPIRFVEGEKEFITGVEKREGMFASTNEDEASFFAALSAIQQGAHPIDKWDEEGRWDTRGQQPWVYKVSSPVYHWELWEPRTQLTSLPFSGKHSDVVVKQRDVQLERVRLVSKDELANAWRWLRDMGKI